METADAITRMQSGERGAAWAFLYQEFFPLVHKAAAAILQDQTEAEDVASQVLLRLPKKIHHYDAAKGGFRGWIWQSAINEALTRRKTVERTQEGMSEYYSTTHSTLEQSEHELRNAGLLHDSIECLAPEDKGLVLDYLAGYVPRELAGKYSQNQRTIQRNTKRAIKHLRHEVLKP